MHTNLIKILHHAVLSGEVPAKALAEEIGKPYSTLMREINPYDTGAKLGAETMFQIIRHTRDVAPLEYMANQLGFALVQSNSEWTESGHHY